MKYRTYKFPVNNGNEVARNSLFGAFIQLMDQKPINQITVLELCQKANISRSAFYWNFSSKEEKERIELNWLGFILISSVIPLVLWQDKVAPRWNRSLNH